MPDANDTNRLSDLAQFESGRGMAPRFAPAEVGDPTPDWPMVIYILPNGDVISRRELTTSPGTKFGSTHLAARSQVVLKVTPQREPGNSDGGAEFAIEVLKCRMSDVKDFLESLVKAHLLEPGTEREMLRRIMAPETEERFPEDDYDPDN